MEIKAGTKILMKAGDGDWNISGLRIQGNRRIQRAEHLRAPGIKVYDRKNVETTVEFTVSQLHESIEDAELHILEHELDIPNRATVTITAIGLQGQRIRRYLKDAGIPSIDHRLMGRTTFTTYRIVGGEMLKQNPGTNTT